MTAAIEKIISAILAFMIGLVGGAAPAIAPINQAAIVREAKDETNLGLIIEPGYKISIFADKLGSPRDLEFDPNGVVVVSIPSQGKVVALPGGQPKTVVEGLNYPHGIAFKNNKLYVAETSAVWVFDYDPQDYKATNKRKIIDLPSGGGHVTRSILIKDDKIYVSIGSSCNACVEADSRRAAIWVANLDGSDFKPFATGLRNSVFMTTDPKTGEIWATDMGQDNLGDDTPFDEVNIIREGNFYGWPYCYDNQVADQQMNKNGGRFDCSNFFRQ